MANLAIALKDEIRRLARKEIKAQTGAMKQALTQYRREIAKLKRELRAHEKKIAFFEARERSRAGQPQIAEDAMESVRFSPRSVKAQRKRLSFSAADYARLVGVSPITIYNWEQGASRPRQKQLAILVSLRGIGKREAMAKLKLLKPNERKAATKARRKRK